MEAFSRMLGAGKSCALSSMEANGNVVSNGEASCCGSSEESEGEGAGICPGDSVIGKLGVREPGVPKSFPNPILICIGGEVLVTGVGGYGGWDVKETGVAVGVQSCISTLTHRPIYEDYEDSRK